MVFTLIFIHHFLSIYLSIYLYTHIYICGHKWCTTHRVLKSHKSKMGVCICNHENNTPSLLLPQWLCDNSCTWAQNVRFMSCHKAIVVITGRAHCFYDWIYIHIYIYIYVYSLLLDFPTAKSGPLARGKRHSHDDNHCVFQLSGWMSPGAS